MIPLTEQQKNNWALFEQLRVKAGASVNDEHALQAVVRQFALRLLEQDPNQEAIVVAGQTLIRFSSSRYSNKASYLAHHRKNGVWGEDPILYTALHALGYQPVMHLAGTTLPAYVPFEQTTTRTPLTIHILNYGAQKGGYHWELHGKSNPGAGNCMYYTLAQQIQRDLPKIARTIQAEIKAVAVLRESDPQPNPAPTPKTEFKSSMPTSQTVHAMPIGANDVSEAVIQASIRHAQVHTDAFEAMKQQLTELTPSQLSTAQLLNYYRTLRDTVDDTYLEGRLNEISKERGDETIAAVINGILPIAAADQNALRVELIHALARESSLRDSSYDYLSGHLAEILKVELLKKTSGQPSLLQANKITLFHPKNCTQEVAKTPVISSAKTTLMVI